MRTKVAKEWVASQVTARSASALPVWVPRKKDGSVDLTTAIGRAFASHGSHRRQQREDYWDNRRRDDLFYDLVVAQRRMAVPILEPTPILATPSLCDDYYGQSSFTGGFETTMPNSIPQIDYHDLKITTDESSELGRGSFGVVLKGKWNGKDVAVKKLQIDILCSFCCFLNSR